MKQPKGHLPAALIASVTRASLSEQHRSHTFQGRKVSRRLERRGNQFHRSRKLNDGHLSKTRGKHQNTALARETRERERETDRQRETICLSMLAVTPATPRDTKQEVLREAIFAATVPQGQVKRASTNPAFCNRIDPVGGFRRSLRYLR